MFYRHPISVISHFELFPTQRHPQKIENQSFHLTPNLMGFQALLLEILALKKGTNFFNRACTSLFLTYLEYTDNIGAISGLI